MCVRTGGGVSLSELARTGFHCMPAAGGGGCWIIGRLLGGGLNEFGDFNVSQADIELVFLSENSPLVSTKTPYQSEAISTTHTL